MTATEPRAELVEAAGLVIATGEAIRLHQVRLDTREWYLARGAAVLAAVLPLLTPADVPHLEAAVREKVAGEIAHRQDSLAWDEMFTVFDAYSDAQDIALGRDGGR